MRLRRRTSTLTGGVLVGALSLVAAPAVAAGWTDSASVTGTTLTAATVPVPATFTCGLLGVLSVQFNWAAVAGATNYTVTLVDSTGTNSTSATTTATTLTANSSSLITGGTATVRANITYPGGTTWTSAASVTRNYTVAVVSLCA